MDLGAYASRTHYADHLLPVWDALGRPGRLGMLPDLSGYPPMAERGAARLQRGAGAMLVASYSDLFRARRLGYGPFVLMQHGAGQSYGGDPRTSGNQHYAGGKDHDDVALFVVPGPDPAARWRAAYPGIPVVTSGLMRRLPEREGERSRTVAVTFHWPCAVLPEMGSAWREYRDAIAALSRDVRWTVLGHWHPRWGGILRDWYASVGIEPVESMDEVARRADVLVADNTSAMFEWAATDRPVVVLNSRRYREHVDHGLRFWQASYVGIQVDAPDGLPAAVAAAYADPPGLRADRRRAVALVYGPGDVETVAAAIAAM